MMRNCSIGLIAIVLASCSQPAEETPVGPTGAAAPEATASADVPEMAYVGPIPLPIRIGGDSGGGGEQMDACGKMAQIANLDSGSDGYASVRDAPSDETKERDRLDAGQMVWVCSSENDWSGVIYSKDGEPAQDCGLASPVAIEANYTGPCSHGWVESPYLAIVAG